MQMSPEKALSPLTSPILSLSLFAWFCCSNSEAAAIVCHFFNTYIMYFIRVRCQSLSVPLHPITQSFKEVGASSLFSFVMHLPPSPVCAFPPLLGIQLSRLLFLWCCHDIRMMDSLSYLTTWQDRSIRSVAPHVCSCLHLDRRSAVLRLGHFPSRLKWRERNTRSYVHL